MVNQDILKYVDQVVSKAGVPAEYKTKLENELIRNIVLASDNPKLDAVMKLMSSPEVLAEEITKKYEYEASGSAYGERAQVQGYCPPAPQHHPRYSGEYMREQSNVNVKLLYIPLLQISSGTERISMPLTEYY